MRTIFIGVLAVFLMLEGCAPDRKPQQEKPKVTPPTFLADSAFHWVQAQVAFGPRVPNTEAHENAARFLADQLKKYGAQVVEQNFEAQSFDGVNLKLKNIIASFYPERTKRILLAAHWDTRPFADKDKNKKNAPMDGANDGASGVGVLLETARALRAQAPPTVGVDIILFDGEDWGELEGMDRTKPQEGYQSWWCLGSQYWSSHKHKSNYVAYYGILLDMVGEKGSHFYREETSLAYAPSIVEKVWNGAQQVGYSDYFVKQNVGAITDDHVFVNKIAKIPMIDIVLYHPGKGFFGDAHHTTDDNLSNIDPAVLQAVGTTLLYVVYNED